MRKDTVKRISGNSDGPRMRAARRFPVTRRAESGVASTPERAVARLDDVARHDATDNHLAAFTWTHSVSSSLCQASDAQAGCALQKLLDFGAQKPTKLYFFQQLSGRSDNRKHFRQPIQIAPTGGPRYPVCY